ncbi:MAG: glycosyltransferase family protein [Magnetococcales bacterium]|nr:glycosyltransferase family protein [Magnetococcales bacterium]
MAPFPFLEQAQEHKNRGNTLLQQGLLDQAAQEYLLALHIQPDHYIALSNLGIVLQAQGRWQEAVDRFSQALAIQPGFAPALSNLGAVLLRMGRLAEAETRLLAALALEPQFPEAHANLGNVYLTLGHWEKAIHHYEYSLQLNPGNHEAWTNLGVVRQRRGELAQAADCFTHALKAKPDYPDAWANRGCLSVELGELPRAMAHFEHALKLAPNLAEAHLALGMALLLIGNFTEGWRHHEWRWRRNGIVGHGRQEPLWDGKALHGNAVLLHCEQGMGDSIQFVRFARHVKERGGTVVLRCPKPLERLFTGVSGVDRLVTREDQIPPCTCQAPLMSLPHILGTTLETIPTTIPYLFPTPPSWPIHQNILARSQPLRVGLVWRGSAGFQDDQKRSMDPLFLQPLLSLTGIWWIGLQVAARPGDLDVFSPCDHFIDASPWLTDFAETAAIINTLDLVIAVDTAVLHLAGALGRPTWALLPFTPDWRWLLHREESPWYPSMRLFRQKRHGDWSEVVERVAAALRLLLT